MTLFGLLALLFLDVCLGLALLGPMGRYAYATLLLYLAGFGLMWGLVRTLPAKWSGATQLWVILLLGAAARLTLLAHPPAYDVHRYVWEGWIQLKGLNPYLHSPEALAHLASPLEHVWTHINHKDLAAAYPPLAELIFRGLAWLNPQPWFFKTALALLDMLAMGFLAVALRARQEPPARLLYYAANPLVLFFLAGEGHLDGLQAFFLCGCLACWTLKRPGGAFFLLGCAAACKYFALIGLPFLVARANWRKVVWFALPWLSFVPFADAGPELFASLGSFGRDFHYNDALGTLLRPIFDWHTPKVLMVILAVGLSLVWLGEHRRFISLRLAFGLFLLCLPTLHPWYLCLVAPLVALAPSPAWLTLMACMGFVFPVVGIEYYSGHFQEVHWLKLLVYGPAAVVAWRAWGRGLTADGPAYGQVRSVSVVVPTLNEAEGIQDCLRSIGRGPELAEVIVADGGSSDGTLDAARREGAAVVQSSPGRGVQIAAGVEAATGDAVLVLHADALAPAGAVPAVARALNDNPWVAGGSFGMRFSPMGWRTTPLAWLNNLRARFAGISFGDQAQFFRREAVAFPALPLMEDVELALRMKEAGGTLFVPQRVRVRGRRWEGSGFGRNVLLVLALMAAYLGGRRLGLTLDGGWFYRVYYGKPPQQLPETQARKAVS